jgi:hypothetical protein
VEKYATENDRGVGLRVDLHAMTADFSFVNGSSLRDGRDVAGCKSKIMRKLAHLHIMPRALSYIFRR